MKLSSAKFFSLKVSKFAVWERVNYFLRLEAVNKTLTASVVDADADVLARGIALLTLRIVRQREGCEVNGYLVYNYRVVPLVETCQYP